MKVKLINNEIKENYTKNLLHERGIIDVEDFLNPFKDKYNSYKDLININNGLKLIDNVLKTQEQIALVVDCDVDGFTSASILYQYLKKLGVGGITYFIHDGKQHGLEDTWEQIQNHPIGKFGLILLPDAGSNDTQYGRNIESPILVIDHHLLEDEEISPNMTIINNQISPNYKNKDLSGAGMAYRFCQAMDNYFEKDYAKEYLDLAALGICGDMMSGLEPENQYFWQKGFSKITNMFFMEIARKQAYSITKKMNATDEDIVDALNPMSVAFYIVPLINAMIRMGTEDEKERLFLAFVDGERLVPCNKRGAKGTKEKVAIESVRECVNARTHQNKLKEEIVGKLEQKIFKHDLLENKVLFIRLEEDDIFPSELNGLVAMVLADRYKRPTIVARLNDEGFIRGSARGLNSSTLESFKDFLENTRLFEYTAGHNNAFGISISNNNLSSFHNLANTELCDFDFDEKSFQVNFIRQASSTDLSDLIIDLGSYPQIWSQQNDTPSIYIKDLNITYSEIKIMGKNNDTCKVVKNGVEYLWFFAKDFIEKIKSINDLKIELVGEPSINTWGGKNTPQIAVKAYEVKDGMLEF